MERLKMDSSNTVAYVRAVARLRNISAAAEELGVTQPALSARIKKVESQLGAPLFDRSRSPLGITDAGRAYLECQDAIDALNRNLEKRIASIESLETGRLVIGGATFFNVTYLPKAVAAFAQRYPGISIQIADDTVPNLTAEALKGEIDLFITPVAGVNSGLAYEKLLTERIFLCVPKQSPVVNQLPKPGPEGFARIGKAEFDLLKDETFILLGSSQQIGQKMAELFKHFGFKPKHTITVEQTMTSLGLTRAGAGVSLITESALINNALDSMPALFLPDEEICQRSLYIARPKSDLPSPAGTEFVKFLKEANTFESSL